MSTIDYEGKKFENDEASRIVDALTIEDALQIHINNEPFMVTMRTPGDDIQLVRGLLHSEGIINDSSFIPDIILKEKSKDGLISAVELTLPKEKLGEGYSNSRSLLSVSSCGICGKKELDELSSAGKELDESRQLHVAIIQDMFHKMKMKQNAFKQSGGSHAAAAFTFGGELLSIKEDIGRHNAVDKVVGDLIINGQLKSAAAITVSGRISYEIIIKAFKAKIPVLCAVSAPSSLAVDYAKELGITLLAFCRGTRATCYSNPHRINTNNLNSKAS